MNKVNSMAVIMNKYMYCTDRRVQQLHKTLFISAHMNIYINYSNFFFSSFKDYTI